MSEIPIDRAPGKGLILAYFRDAMLFAPYEIKDGKLCCEGLSELSAGDMTECHLFDRDTEFRVVYRASRGDTIELLLSESEEKNMDPDLLYKQTVLVKKEYADKPGIPGKLTIVNRYSYSENDTLVLKNYRISC